MKTIAVLLMTILSTSRATRAAEPEDLPGSAITMTEEGGSLIWRMVTAGPGARPLELVVGKNNFWRDGRTELRLGGIKEKEPYAITWDGSREKRVEDVPFLGIRTSLTSSAAPPELTPEDPLQGRLQCPDDADVFEETTTHTQLQTCVVALGAGIWSQVAMLSLEFSNGSVSAAAISWDRVFWWFNAPAGDLSFGEVWVRPSEAHVLGVELVRMPNQDLVMLTETRDGWRDGSFYVLYPDGSPAVIGRYAEDVPFGQWVWLSPEGELASVSEFVFGVEYRLEDTGTGFMPPDP